MATNSLHLDKNLVVSGLGTFSYTVVADGTYTVRVQSTIPHAAGGTSNTSTDVPTEASALSIVVNQDVGGGPVAKVTVDTPSPYQPIMGTSVSLLCAAGDVLSVVLSSSSAADALPNAVKSSLNLFTGE